MAYAPPCLSGYLETCVPASNLPSVERESRNAEPILLEVDLMRLDPEHAHRILPRVDPGRVRSGRAVGLRDGALIALVAGGMTAVEIVALRAMDVTMDKGEVRVAIHGYGTRLILLPTNLGARLLAWLSECHQWDKAEPVFRGPRGPLTPMGIYKIIHRHRNANPAGQMPALRSSSC
jgi:integrase